MAIFRIPGTPVSLSVSVRHSLAMLLVLWIAWVGARPFGDGDAFFHLAHARQMLATQSLHLDDVDHAVHSWLPALDGWVYCTWAVDLLLLGVWSVAGIGGLAALSYGGLLLIVAWLAWFARRAGVIDHPLTWVLIALSVLLGLQARTPKPALVSLVLWHALLFCYFRFRMAVRQGTNPRPWLYAVPALMLVWVNAHGGFILSAPFLALTLAAEWVPAWMRPHHRLPQRWRLELTAAWTATLVATLATPYGVRYLVYLVGQYAPWSEHPEFAEWAFVSEYASAFSTVGRNVNLPEFLVCMALAWPVLLAYRARRGPVDWLIPLLNLAYVPLYVAYLRSSWLLPALFAYSVIWLVTEPAREPEAPPVPAWVRRVLAGGTVLLFVFWLGRPALRLLTQPNDGTGFGFVDAVAPVEEAEFLARANAGPRLYNTYNAGSYLIWRLFPQYKVLVDSRWFPYPTWFTEQSPALAATSPEPFKAFLAQHPANAALIELGFQQMWRNFLAEPGWRPAFYGPGAVVFLKQDAPAPLAVANGVRTLRTSRAAFLVFDFAVAAGDFRTAWRALDQASGPLRRRSNPAELRWRQQYREAHAALRAADYARAEQLFVTAFKGRTPVGRHARIFTLLRQVREANAGTAAADTDAAIKELTTLAAPDGASS